MSYKSALDDLFGFHDLKRSFFDDAEVAERLNAPVLKTGGSYGSEGSNPSFSVKMPSWGNWQPARPEHG